MYKSISVIVVFLCGIGVTGLEVASARIVSPYFGSTIYVWGGAIGTVLAALAVGYWMGGRIIDQYPTKKTIAVVLLIAAVSTLAIPWMYSGLGTWFSRWSSTSHVPVGVAVIGMMGALFLIPIVALGMVSPMALRLSLSDLKTAGSWSGLLSGAATFGSIIGTFLSAYLTIPQLGTRATIIGASMLLFATASAVAVPGRKLTFLILAALVATATYTASTPYVAKAKLAYEKESAYQLVQVIERNGIRYLVHDTGGGYQSSYRPGAAFTESPYDFFGILPYLTTGQSRQRSVLLIGLGGGNMIRLYHDILGKRFDFSLTGVEIDPVVIDVAKRYFDISRMPLTIVQDDARHYLRTHADKYDIIIVDAYTHEMQVPVMLATKEFFTDVRDHLRPGGVLGMNALAFPTSRYFPKLLDTVASSFPKAVEGKFRDGPYNHLIVAGTDFDLGALPKSIDPIIDPYLRDAVPNLQPIAGSNQVYTDDRTDLDVRVRPFLD